jgi:tRNA modification GTPase
MSILYDDSPIIACSTGTTTNSAIAIIRLSGFKNILDLKPFFSFNLLKIIPRQCHLTNILFNDSILDNILICFFPEGKSFTGENVLELHVHGNQLNILRITNLFVDHAQFRIAFPGEFSYRALKNKKLTLSQAEGLDLILNANSNLMINQGLNVIQGELNQSYHLLYDYYLTMNSALELMIDFSDDVGEEQAIKLYLDAFIKLRELLCSLMERSSGSLNSLLTPEVVLVGETNVGKSSLFNILLSQNRSIVSNIAGTTRDYVSETFFINGTHFSLVDTAGIRDSNDEIEMIGVGRSLDILNRSFLKILVINPFSFDENFLDRVSHFTFDLVIFSHSDLDNFDLAISKFPNEKLNFSHFCFASFLSGSIGPIIESGSIGPVIESGSIGPVIESGSIGPTLKDFISSKFEKESSGSPIILERHRNVISGTYNFVTSSDCNFEDLADLGLLSNNLKRLSYLLSELIGFIPPDDVLNSVFSNFCIGK